MLESAQRLFVQKAHLSLAPQLGREGRVFCVHNTQGKRRRPEGRQGKKGAAGRGARVATDDIAAITEYRAIGESIP
jgi:hypothetical protein